MSLNAASAAEVRRTQRTGPMATAQAVRAPPGCGHVDKAPARGQRGYTLPTARRLAHMPTAEQPF